MGIGLATGAPDTQTAPTTHGTPTRDNSTPGRLPDRGFRFFGLCKIQPTLRIEDHDMNYSTYYRNDSDCAWRFSTLRSGQSAASDRSLTGGKCKHPADTANCRTPQ